MKTVKRKVQVGVIGANTSIASKKLLEIAKELGHKLVDNNIRIISGGHGGIMEAVSHGGQKSTNHQDGDVIGVLPEINGEKANSYIDTLICTGIGYARNQVICASSDIVVAIGGGAGTLSEISFAWQLGKPIIALKVNEGWSSKMAGKCLDDRRDEPIHSASTVDEVLEHIQDITNTLF